jgi:hypothetical protein
MVSSEDVVETIRLKPDAGLVKSLGAHYSLESAIADLVDNCLDAAATKVTIRLLTENDRLVQVEVIDNGIDHDERSIPGPSEAPIRAPFPRTKPESRPPASPMAPAKARRVTGRDDDERVPSEFTIWRVAVAAIAVLGPLGCLA